MKKVLAKDLCYRDVGRTVFLGEGSKEFSQITSVFAMKKQIIALLESGGGLTMGPEDFVRMAEKDDFVKVGVAQ